MHARAHASSISLVFESAQGVGGPLIRCSAVPKMELLKIELAETSLLSQKTADAEKTVTVRNERRSHSRPACGTEPSRPSQPAE